MAKGERKFFTEELRQKLIQEFGSSPPEKPAALIMREFAARYELGFDAVRVAYYKKGGVKDFIQTNTRATAMMSTDPSVRAEARFPDLKPMQRLFLEHFRESCDRVDSATRIGKLWREVEADLDEDQAFFDAFLDVERERTVMIEDKQVSSALEGKNAAQQKMALEARSAAYAKKSGRGAVPQRRAPATNGKFDAESVWGRIFGQNTMILTPEEKPNDAADTAGTDEGSGEGDELAVAGLA